MKKIKNKKKTHVVKKDKPKKVLSLIIELTDGKKYDFFKLPHDVREKVKIAIPAVAEEVKRMKRELRK